MKPHRRIKKTKELAKKSKIKYQIIFVLGLIFWLGVIFLFSSEQSLHSPFSHNVDLFLRKMAHILEYFILTFFVYWALFFFKNNLLLSIFLVALSYAFFDEWHQSFVIGREGTLRDVLFDLVGIFLGVYFINKQRRFLPLKSQKKLKLS